MTQAYALLFSPIEIGGITLRNRIAHASMTTRYGKDQRVTQRLIDYHAARAAGGAAMLITEPLALLKFQANVANKIRAYDDDELDGLARWAAAVRAHDSHLIAQVQEPGRGTHHKGRRPRALGATALPDDLSWTVPHPLRTEEIPLLVEEFAAAARRLQLGGFSGVEISAGHGHLFHQFLSPWSNRRTDCYGGSLENRARFLVDTIAAIRAATDRPFIIAVKLPGEDGVAGGIDFAAAAELTTHVARTGEVDALTWCQGSHHRTLENHVPDMRWPRMPFNDLIRRLRPYAEGVPVAALGRIIEPLQAEQALEEGVGDFVQVGRALITDPAWGLKAASGREADIRLCVSCNTCWGLLSEYNPLACDNNPRTGLPDELDWSPTPTAKPKRIVVVGAGVAGLEAAWVAATRGHEVTVLTAGQSYGGNAALYSQLPESEQVSSIYDYQIVKAQKAGVRLEYGIQATADDVLVYRPDTVILATGASLNWPSQLPDDWREFVPDLRAASRMMLDGFPPTSGTAVLIDEDHGAATYAAAELMAKHFAKVVIATPRPNIAEDEYRVTQQGIHRRLSMLGVEILTLVEPCGDSDLMNGVMTFANVYSGARTDIQNVELLSFATARTPNAELEEPLLAAGVEVFRIGDAYAPRQILSAMGEGHERGNLV